MLFSSTAVVSFLRAWCPGSLSEPEGYTAFTFYTPCEATSTNAAVMAIVLLILSLFFSMGSGLLESGGDFSGTESAEYFSDMLNLSAGIVLLIQTFKVKKILQEHLCVRSENEGVHTPSGLAAFFFGIFYLQHVINRDLVLTA